MPVYSQVLDLHKLDVYYECTPNNPEFFQIKFCIIYAPIIEKKSNLRYINSNISFKLLPLAEEKGFFLGYSPERINPGDKEHTFTTIKKVVSGSTPEAAEIIAIT